jgi:hypothetical protein
LERIEQKVCVLGWFIHLWQCREGRVRVLRRVPIAGKRGCKRGGLWGCGLEME